ncbi:MAG: type IX secretion system membrane protein PorP/SprF [Bacteroidales bacterium]|jgi:type IX secretion system PorP/SprF family membrane protein|nr:type IX secretion system membrane protein PorP/SprF [Bacteroidales bacterium]
MRSLKLILFISISFVFINPVNAQQTSMYSQYMFNEYMINPAVAGTFNYFQIRGNFRNQWIGIKGGPQTMSISGYGPFKEREMGYGGYIYNDVTGPEGRLSLGGTYAYNMQITDEWRISGGISFGMFQYKLDRSKLTSDPTVYDPLMNSTVDKKTMLDATAGIYAWTSYYYVGLSAHQLLGNKYNLYESGDTIQGISRLTQHIYLTGGANFILTKEFILSPSVLIKYSSPGVVQADITATLFYNQVAWFGLSYRTSDAIVVMAGYNYNLISLGIAYDITVSDIRKYSGSTLEIMLVYKFNSIK